MKKTFFLIFPATGLLFLSGPRCGAEESAATAVETASPALTAPLVEKPADDRLASALRDLEDGNWRRAQRKAKSVLAGNKKNSQAWLVWGRSCLSAGKYKKATKRFQKALRYDPRFAEAYFWRARAFESWGRTDEAMNEYQAAFHADPAMESARSAWKNLQGPAPSSEE
ncbi:MAG TPA: tetratricopeptide repeat protein [Elusimicrobiota bacterium]|nr:tetratricopeptide repeat protein [Elusimicrobiota bacterium]